MPRERSRFQVEHKQHCPLCHERFGEDPTDLAQCQACETVYHRACAREMGGCATMGCARQGQQPRGEVSDEVLRSVNPYSETRHRVRRILGWLALALALAPLLPLGLLVVLPGSEQVDTGGLCMWTMASPLLVMLGAALLSGWGGD